MKILPACCLVLCGLSSITLGIQADEKSVTKTLTVDLGADTPSITVPPEIIPDEVTSVDLPFSDGSNGFIMPGSIPIGNNVPGQSNNNVSFSATGVTRCTMIVSSPNLNAQGAFAFRAEGDPIGTEEIAFKLKAAFTLTGAGAPGSLPEQEIDNAQSFTAAASLNDTPGNCGISMDNPVLTDFQPGVIPGQYSGIKVAKIQWTLRAE